MKNEYLNNAVDSQAEDLIRAMVQFGCAEIHAKSLYEQATAELENGLVEIENPEVLDEHLKKTELYLKATGRYAELRRSATAKLYEMYGSSGDRKMWCMVKHLGVGSMQAFEAYLASNDDNTLLQLAIESNKAFVEAITAFIGAEITDCAACLGDYLKASS